MTNAPNGEFLESLELALGQGLKGPDFSPFADPETLNFAQDLASKITPIIQSYGDARVAEKDRRIAELEELLRAVGRAPDLLTRAAHNPAEQGDGSAAKPCSNCERPATTRYDGDDMCEACARYCAQRDFEEGDDMSNLMGG